uniref:Uncharacterized protein n=1 Tax=Solanum tuberosum TaxID=4113 RepID=M1B7I8_SOLTU
MPRATSRLIRYIHLFQVAYCVITTPRIKLFLFAPKTRTIYNTSCIWVNYSYGCCTFSSYIH